MLRQKIVQPTCACMQLQNLGWRVFGASGFGWRLCGQLSVVLGCTCALLLTSQCRVCGVLKMGASMCVLITNGVSRR